MPELDAPQMSSHHIKLQLVLLPPCAADLTDSSGSMTGGIQADSAAAAAAGAVLVAGGNGPPRVAGHEAINLNHTATVRKNVTARGGVQGPAAELLPGWSGAEAVPTSTGGLVSQR